jgi:hypothetical protein
MKVNKICILGGGTSGFSVASMLAKYSKNANLPLEIVVVYSSKIGNIGVGESTLLSVNDLFSFLELKDEDWMKECNATYKTSIAFEDFYKVGKKFQYPFGNISTRDDNYGQKWFELKEHYPEIFTEDTFARYIIPHTMLNEKNKLSDNLDAIGFNIDHQSSYHFDTNLLAKFLKKYCTDRGVTFIDDTYLESKLNSKGYIKEIVCNNNTISADLFIDCSGFKSLLLEKVMGSEFLDFNDTLINNRVVRAKIPYTDKEKQLKNYTNCVAMSNGWCWEIPLWDSLSLGYVHSLKFANEENILQEFKDRCGVTDDDISIVNYKTGRHEKGWVKNVVGVGLSYGFLEPLESTGIATLLNNSFRLIEFLSKRDLFYTKIDRDIFNHSVAKEIDTLRGFIELHYALSSREDSEYWNYVTEDVNYPCHKNSQYHTAIVNVVERRDYVYNNTNMNGQAFLLAGMNYSHYSPAFIKMDKVSTDLLERKNYFLQQEEFVGGLVDALPSSYKYLKEKIYHE